MEHRRPHHGFLSTSLLPLVHPLQPLPLQTPQVPCALSGCASHKQRHHPASASPATGPQDYCQGNVFLPKVPVRTLLFPQTSYLMIQLLEKSIAFSMELPRDHCFLDGITQIPNASLRNTKTGNRAVHSCHLAKDRCEIARERG